MKFLADLFPVLLFFGAYWFTRDMFIATGVAMVSTVLQVAVTWVRHRKVEMMQWVSLGLIVVLGGATLLLHDKHFIMWKPTLLYWIMGGGLLAGSLAGKNGMRAVMGQQINLPDGVWKKLNLAWSVFFLAMGGINLLIAYHFSEEIWVNFKLFGGIGLMVAFVIAQSLYLSKYIEDSK